MASDVQLVGLTKRFEATVAAEAIDLRIRAGEFFGLLGPRGSGKTTILRMIAGFESPEEGSVHFGERDITAMPPNKRNVGMVFQDYALFPHMSVAENVAFGLEARHLPKAEIEAKVRAAVSTVDLAGSEDRSVQQLSGGEQQRVALARALVIRPDVLLLDDPLSNLDDELRSETRSRLRELVHESGVTTLYVTRDPEEALALSDRLAVLHEGRIEQTGTTTEVYLSPANEFVARFMGHQNILPGTVSGADPYSCTVAIDGSGQSIMVPPFDARVDEAVTLVLRAESLELQDELAPAPRHPNYWKGSIVSCEFRGPYTSYTIRLFGREVAVYQATRDNRLRKGEVSVSLSPEQVHVVRG